MAQCTYISIPSSDPLDPLNWTDRKKHFEIILIAFQTFSSSYMAAGITPAYESMALKYGVKMYECSYFTSSQICALGVFPFLWVPLINVYDRSLSAFSAWACCVLNIGGGFAQHMVNRWPLEF